MARLPDLSGQERPLPRLLADVAPVASETGLEMVPSRAMAEMGSDITRGGLEVVAAQEHERRLLDAQAKAEAKQREAERKAMEKEAQRTAGIRAYTDFGNDVGDLSQQLTQQLQTGAIKPADALSGFDTQVKALQDKYAKDHAPEVLDPVRIHMDNVYRDSRRQLLGTLEGVRRSSILENIVATEEGLQRRGFTDPYGAIGAHAALDTVLRAAGMKPEEIAKRNQNFAEGVIFNFAQRQVNTASNDPAALKTLNATLKDTTQYPELDPDKRRILLNQVENRQMVLQAKAEHEQEKRENAAGRSIQAYINLSLAGQQPDATAMAALQTQVRGTSYAKQFSMIQKTLQENQQFASLPPTEMAKKLDEDVTRQAKGFSSVEEAQALQLQIARRSQALKLTMDQLSSDPNAYLNRTAGIDPGAVNFDKPEDAMAVIRQRQANLSTLAQKVPTSQAVFRPVELDEFQNRLAGAGAKDRAGMLGQLAVTLGPTSAAYRDTMQQLAPKSPVTAFAGEMMPKKPQVAELMLRGEDILKQLKEAGKGGQVKIGKEQDFNAAFNASTGKLFGAGDEQVRETYYQATKAVYAALSQQAYDYNEQVDGGRVKKAFNMVAGDTVRWNGVNVLPPIGMQAGQFRTAIEAQFNAARAAGRVDVPASYVYDSNLVKLKGSRYALQNGSSVLPDAKTGRPFVLDLDAPLPPVVTEPKYRSPRTSEDRAATYADVMRGRPK